MKGTFKALFPQSAEDCVLIFFKSGHLPDQHCPFLEIWTSFLFSLQVEGKHFRREGLPLNVHRHFIKQTSYVFLCVQLNAMMHLIASRMANITTK